MIVGLGIDIVEISRIRALYQRHTQHFLNRILTEAEQAYVLNHRDPAERIAGRWTAKEAAVKALGTGIAEGVRWRDIEVLPDAFGKPILTFRGRAGEISQSLQAEALHVSITHSQEWAMAQVILEKR